MLKLLADATLFSWNAVNEEVVGEVTTFTYSSTHIYGMMIFGLVLATLGVFCLWVTKGSLQNNGRYSYALLLVGIIGLSTPLIIGHCSVVLTPSQIEMRIAREPDIIPMANIRSIDKREEAGFRGRTTIYYDFHLIDGSTKKYKSDGLVETAVERLAALAKKGAIQGARAPENAARVPVAAAPPEPPAAAASIPAAASPPPGAPSSSQRAAELLKKKLDAKRLARANRTPATPPPTATPPVSLPPAAAPATAGPADPTSVNSTGDQEVASNSSASPEPAAPAESAPARKRPDSSPKHTPTATAEHVTATMPLAAGVIVQAKWGAVYYQAEVVEVLPMNMVRIHYLGWSQTTDETVPRDNLWIEPADLPRKTARPRETAADDLPASDEAAASDDSTAMRTWTDSTGKHKVEAEFLGFADGKVRLKRRDGKQVSMPLKRLSPADQDFVRSQTKGDAEHKTDPAKE